MAWVCSEIRSTRPLRSLGRYDRTCRNGVDASKTRQACRRGVDASSSRHCEHPEGSLLCVNEQGARSNNAEMRRIYAATLQNAQYIRRFLFDGAGAQLAFHFRQLNGNDFGNAFFLHRYTEQGVCLVHGRLSVGDNDELRAFGETL